MVTLLCPSCGNKWDYKGFKREAKCPECEEKVEVRRNIDWETSGSFYSKIHSKS